MRPFVITGCGRSGSLYIARFLSRLGIRTAHEEFFTAYTSPTGIPDYHWWLATSKTAGESSSLAVPYLSRLCNDVAIFHQVRNPVAVMRSLMGLKTFDPGLGMRHLPNLRFFFRHIPEADHDDEPIVLAMKYWLYWNRSVSKFVGISARYRTEDIVPRAPTFQAVLDTIGAEVSPEKYAEAVAKYVTTYNGNARDSSVTWANLPNGELKTEISYDAQLYGYTLAELETA